MKSVFIFFILMYGTISVAKADNIWLDINLVSYHPSASNYTYDNKTEKLNQFNYGIGVSYETNRFVELESGFFRNSYNKNSIYADVKIKYDFIIKQFTITPGMAIGGVSGYKNTEVEANTVQFVALPTVAISYNRIRVVVGYMPLQLVTNKAKTDVITVQAGIRF